MTDTTTATDRQARIDAICRAAIPVFAKPGIPRYVDGRPRCRRGHVETSPVSVLREPRRPLPRRLRRTSCEARNRGGARAALDGAGLDTTDRLDGYLQRLSGDGYEQLAATPHGDELMEAKHEFAEDVAVEAYARARAALRDFVGGVSGSPATTDAVVDLLNLSPLGLKSDRPSPAAYRARLRSLARAAVALLDEA